MQKSSILSFLIYGIWIWQTARMLPEFMSDMKSHKSYLSHKLQSAISVCRAHLQNSWGAWEEGILAAAALTALPVPARIQAAWAECSWKRRSTNGGGGEGSYFYIFIKSVQQHAPCTDEYLQNQFKILRPDGIQIKWFMKGYFNFLVEGRDYSLWLVRVTA